MVYWLVVGPRSQQRPEIRAFCDWLMVQAGITRKAIGEQADPETEAHPD
jgi:LysR family transcriptional regulator, glycine cleavage system transcriptional activator